MKTAEIKKLDAIWKKKIKERDSGVCQICGETSYLNAHHIVGRRNRNVRWEMDNGIALCSGCHTFKIISAHQDPAWFMDLFIKRYPERYKNIMALRVITRKQTYDEVSNYLDSL